jgi:DNA-binding SARP family transcriptional activator/streptogramin lyase
MEFRVLGPLELRDGDASVRLGGTKQRALLALLLLRANTVVSKERLIDALWGEEPPETAMHSLHAHVSQLRKLLRESGADADLVTEGTGYALRVAPELLDLRRFLERADAGRRAFGEGRVEFARAHLDEALAMWRGEPLSDLPHGAIPAHEIARLAELRLAATEDRIDADLAVGHHAEVISELQALMAEHALRERLRAQLMLALYRSGRQAEALHAYDGFRQLLGEQLGIDPTPALQQLHERILRQDADLQGTPPTAPVQTTPKERPPRRRAVIAAATVALVVALIAVVLISRDDQGPTAIGLNSVGRIDPISGSLLASIPTTGAGAGPLAYADGSLWVANTFSRTLVRVDPETDQVSQSMAAGGAPTALAAGNRTLWVLNGFDGEVLAIDTRTNDVAAPIEVPQGAGGIAVGAGFVWVTNTFETTVTKINPVSGEVVATIPLGAPGSGSPEAIAVTHNAVWIGDGLAPVIWKVDAHTDLVSANPGLRGIASGLAVGEDGRVWASSFDENLVTVLDPVRLRSTTYDVGRGPADLVAAADGIWVVESLAGSISRLDPATGAIRSRIEVGTEPQAIEDGAGSLWISRAA